MDAKTTFFKYANLQLDYNTIWIAFLFTHLKMCIYILV